MPGDLARHGTSGSSSGCRRARVSFHDADGEGGARGGGVAAARRADGGSPVSEAMTVGVFGGSFNPPHVGHVLAVAYVLSVEPVDRCWWSRGFDHPLGKSLAPFAHRKAMCELGATWPASRCRRSSRRWAPPHALHAPGAQGEAPGVVVGSSSAPTSSTSGRSGSAGTRSSASAPPIVLGRVGHPTRQARRCP